MPLWQYTLEIADEWEKASSGEITAFKLADIIAKKLTSLQPIVTSKFGESSITSEFESIIDQFEYFSKEKNDNFNDFDYIMTELYELADTIVGDKTKWPPHKLMWINTL